MRLFKREPTTRLEPTEGFARGQVVYHKVSGVAAVIISFERGDENGMRVFVSRGFTNTDDFECYLAEVTLQKPDPSPDPPKEPR